MGLLTYSPRLATFWNAHVHGGERIKGGNVAICKENDKKRAQQNNIDEKPVECLVNSGNLIIYFTGKTACTRIRKTGPSR